MSSDMSLNMQLLNSLSTNNLYNTDLNLPQTGKPTVYAKSGDPNYNEEMDTDMDGTVTMEEYQEYCKNNNINIEEQVATVQNKIDNLMQKQVQEAGALTSDNVISYSEYMQYCEANAVSAPSTQAAIKPEDIKTNESGLQIRNFGKALNSYSSNQINLPQAKIERKA